MDSNTPDPGLMLFAKGPEFDSLTRKQLDCLVAACHREEFPIREKGRTKRIKAENTFLSHKLSTNAVKAEILTPVRDTQEIRVSISGDWWIPGECIDRAIRTSGTFYLAFLLSSFVPNRDNTICESQSYVLTIIRPRTRIHPYPNLVFLHRLLLTWPNRKIRQWARS